MQNIYCLLGNPLTMKILREKSSTEQNQHISHFLIRIQAAGGVSPRYFLAMGKIIFIS